MTPGEAQPEHPGRWFNSTRLRNIIGVLISIVCIGFVAMQIDFNGVANAISSFKLPYLAFGVLSLTAGYCARIIRWSMMLRAAGAHAPVRKCIAPFLGSIALNNVLPARLGDVVRALVFPAALGISRTVSTGTLVMERLADLATLLLFLALGLVAYPSATLPESTKLSAAILAIIAVASLALMFAFSGMLSGICTRLAERNVSPLAKRALGAGSTLLASFEAMSRARVLAGLFSLSVLVWLGEAGLFLAFLNGFGISASPASAAIVMAIATLATLVPSSPGYVGPFHLAAYAAMTILGSSTNVAASFAILAHAGIWLPTTLAGTLAILLNPGLFGGRGLRLPKSTS